MKALCLAVAMMASSLTIYAQVNAGASSGETSAMAKPQSQTTKHGSMGGRDSSPGNSNLGATNHLLGDTAGVRSRTATVSRSHPSSVPKTIAARHHTSNPPVIGGPVNTNKGRGGALNGTTMKRKP